MKGMKCILVFLLGMIFSSIVYAESLHDVNYDKLVSSQKYDANIAELRNIYLHYERTIALLEEKIRKEEQKLAQKRIEVIQLSENEKRLSLIAQSDNQQRQLEEALSSFKDSIEELKKEEDMKRQTLLEKHKEEIANLKAESEERQLIAIQEARNEMYQSEIQSLREEETQRLTQEIVEKVSREVHAQLSAEYEKKKNEEIKGLYSELKREALQETRQNTERIKYIAFAIIGAFVLFLIVWLVMLVGKKMRQHQIERKESKKIRQKRKEEDKTCLALWTDIYFEKLKEFQGKGTALIDEIDDVSDHHERMLRHKAFQEAQKKYNGHKHLQSLDKYQSSFDDALGKIEKEFGHWNGNQNDLELLNGIPNKFGQHLNAIDQSQSELAASLNRRDKSEQKHGETMVKSVGKSLERYSKRIKALGNERGIKNDLKIKINQVSIEYKKLSKKMQKGGDK